MGNSPSQAPANNGEDEEKKRRESTASSSGSGVDMLKAGAAVAGTALLALGTWQLLSQSLSAADTEEKEAVNSSKTGRLESDRFDSGRYQQLEGFTTPSQRNRGELYIPPPFGVTDRGYIPNVIKILSYNVWFSEDKVQERMTAIGDLIQQHSPDLICFQEVTPKIHEIFENSSWGEAYSSSISPEQASKRRSYPMQMSKLPATFKRVPLIVLNTARDLCMAEVDVGMGRKLLFASCHLKSPNPDPQNPDRMHSTERVEQVKKALNLLNNSSPNVVLGGDLNWDEEVDGTFPLPPAGWVDAWKEKRPEEDGWTFDTVANEMLSRKAPLQKRLDRFLCCLEDFGIGDIKMIGTEPIRELSSKKKKILPSDHFGLLLTLYRQ